MQSENIPLPPSGQSGQTRSNRRVSLVSKGDLVDSPRGELIYNSKQQFSQNVPSNSAIQHLLNSHIKNTIPKREELNNVESDIHSIQMPLSSTNKNHPSHVALQNWIQTVTKRHQGFNLQEKIPNSLIESLMQEWPPEIDENLPELIVFNINSAKLISPRWICH